MIDKILLPNADEAFFAEHRDRYFRIRKLVHAREYESEFQSLGPHEFRRRRVIVVRVAPPGIKGQPLLPIPFLLFGDETITDDDATLRPIVDELMRDAAESYGMKPRKR